MALTDAQSFNGNGKNKQFQILGAIPSESHLRVWINDVILSSDKWDLLGNIVLLDEAPLEGEKIDFIVSTTGTDLPASPSDVGIVALNIDDIISVADSMDTIISSLDNEVNINAVVANESNINAVASNEFNINSVVANESNINSLVANEVNINAVVANELNINTVANNELNINNVSDNMDVVLRVDLDAVDIGTVSENVSIVEIVANDLGSNFSHQDDYGSITSPIESAVVGTSHIINVSNNIDTINVLDFNMVNINAVGNDIASVNTNSTNINSIIDVSTNMASVVSAVDNANEAEKSKWISEASKMTSDSYATEPEDVFVKEYTSNDDGTFTVTNTSEYSALHWAIKTADLVSEGVIDDDNASAIKTYSSNKVQALHDAQANTIANLATANAEIVNATTPAVASIPKYPLVSILDFNTLQQSTLTSIFEINDVNNVMTFKENANYSFLSTIQIKSNVNASRLVKFLLVNNDDDTIVKEIDSTLTIASGTVSSIPMSVLLTVDAAPLNIRVEISCSDTGFELRSFSSIISSGTGFGSESIDNIDDALGGIVSVGSKLTDIVITTNNDFNLDLGGL